VFYLLLIIAETVETYFRVESSTDDNSATFSSGNVCPLPYTPQATEQSHVGLTN